MSEGGACQNGDKPSEFRLLLLVFLPFALGYFLSYLFRTVNAVIAPELVQDVMLDAADLGLLTSAYFITFAAVQLPLGIVLDTLGPRRVEVVLLVIGAAGGWLFSIGDSAWSLIVARGLIGVGVAACLMAALKAMADWYPSERLPLMNGLIVAAGGFGAVMATAPTKALVAEVGWRSGFELLALATLAVAALLWFVVPDRSRIAAPDDGASSLAGVGRVFSSRNFWTITPIAATLMGTFLAIQSLWSGPWLRDVAGLDTDRAASVLLVAAFGFIVGNVLNGTLAVWAGRRGISTPLLLVFGIALFMLLQIALVAGWTAHIDILWFAFGYLGTTGILTYSVLTRTFPMHLAGRATTAMNLVVFVAAFALQWGMGVVINQWPVAADGGFDPRGYQAAFAFALALQVASFIVFLIGYRKLVPIEE